MDAMSIDFFVGMAFGILICCGVWFLSDAWNNFVVGRRNWD